MEDLNNLKIPTRPNRSVKNISPNNSRFHILSGSHGTFYDIDDKLGYKTSLNKFEDIEIIQSMFSDDNGMKLEINSIYFNALKLEIRRKFR